MDIQDRITRDLAAAMKARAGGRVAVLRLIKSSLINEQKNQGGDLTEEQVLRVLQREAKQRQQSIEAFEAGGRPEQAEAERKELQIIQEYLPQPLSEADLEKLVDAAIDATGAANLAETGQVIGVVMKEAGPAADGAVVARLVRQKLQERQE